MRLRNIVFLVIGLGLASVFMLPLRTVKERTYVSEEIRLRSGTIKAAVDGTYYPMPVTCWYDGLQTDAPFRLRAFYRPNDAAKHQLAVTRAAIKDGALSHQLAVGSSRAGWYLDQDGSPVCIMGFLNVPLTTSDVTVELELSLDGVPTSAKMRLVHSTTTKIVHSGWEALMSI